MIPPAKNIVVLGSTGSIGCSTLDVVAASEGRFRVVAITAHRNLSQVVEQAGRFRPKWVVATDAQAADGFA